MGQPRADHRLALAPGLESIWPGKKIADIVLPSPFVRNGKNAVSHPDLPYDEIFPPLRFYEDEADSTSIGYVEIALSPVARALDRYWGRGRKSTATASTPTIWLDREQRIRAVACEIGVLASDHNAYLVTVVRIDPYTPLDEFIGPPGPTMGFEKLPLLGAKVDDVLATYGALAKDKDGQITLALPNTEYDWENRATLTPSDGRITSLSFEFTTLRDPDRRSGFIAKVCKKLAPTERGCSARYLARHNGVELHPDHATAVRVIVSDGKLQIVRQFAAEQ